MMTGMSIEDVMAFLEGFYEDGGVRPETVNGWRLAVQKAYGVLTPSERDNINSIDVDEVIRRLSVQSNYSDSTLNNYKSRLKNSLDVFIQYLIAESDNRIETKTVNNHNHSFSRSGRNIYRESSGRVVDTDTFHRKRRATNTFETFNFQVPLRAGLTVDFNNLPTDLTREEAERISNVLFNLIQQ
ncbi:MAG: hypothetical protein OCD01_09835 [Fibrobacterales bacterium]